MRKLLLSLTVTALAALVALPAGAQEPGTEITLTGCLAQDDDDEFELTGVDAEDVMAAEIELIAGEGVNLAPHVGHTVEAEGVVVADDDEDEGAMDDEDEGAMDEDDDAMDEDDDAEDDELHIRVTVLGHVAASCSDS